MKILVIFSLVMGVIMTITYMTFIRTDKKMRPNPFEMLILIAIATSAMICNILFPTWWGVALQAYFMVISPIWLENREEQILKEQRMFWKYIAPRSYPVPLEVVYPLIGAVLIPSAIIILRDNWTWYSAIVWIPLGSIGTYIIFMLLRSFLKNFWYQSLS